MSSQAPRLRIGVVGTGALGRHHVRLLSSLPQADLVGIHDVRSEVAEAVAAEFGTRAFSDWSALAEETDAIVLAVPTEFHAEIGCQLLSAGTHVLVEKPIASSLSEADRMLGVAGKSVLAVGHVEFYNPAVQNLLSQNVRPGFVEVQRLGVFSPRSLDIDVILDLMIHDLQILHALDPSDLTEVRAVGINVLSQRIDIASVRLELGSGCVANLTASRVSFDRVRRLRVFDPDRGYFSLDYQQQTIKRHRLDDTGSERRIVSADVAVEPYEPLRGELEAFLAACQGVPVAYVDGAQGRRALSTALAVAGAIT